MISRIEPLNPVGAFSVSLSSAAEERAGVRRPFFRRDFIRSHMKVLAPVDFFTGRSVDDLPRRKEPPTEAERDSLSAARSGQPIATKKNVLPFGEAAAQSRRRSELSRVKSATDKIRTRDVKFNKKMNEYMKPGVRQNS